MLCAVVSPAVVAFSLRAHVRLDEDRVRVGSRSLPYSEITRVVVLEKALHLVPRAGRVVKLSALGPLAARFVMARWMRVAGVRAPGS